MTGPNGVLIGQPLVCPTTGREIIIKSKGDITKTKKEFQKRLVRSSDLSRSSATSEEGLLTVSTLVSRLSVHEEKKARMTHNQAMRESKNAEYRRGREGYLLDGASTMSSLLTQNSDRDSCGLNDTESSQSYSSSSSSDASTLSSRKSTQSSASKTGRVMMMGNIGIRALPRERIQDKSLLSTFAMKFHEDAASKKRERNRKKYQHRHQHKDIQKSTFS